MSESSFSYNVTSNNSGQYQIEVSSKSEAGAEKTATAVLNSSVATLTFSGVITKNILDGLNNPITPLDASGSSGTGSTADVDTITSAVGMVDLLTGGKSLQNCSLNELMSIVSFLLLVFFARAQRDGRIGSKK